MNGRAPVKEEGKQDLADDEIIEEELGQDID